MIREIIAAIITSIMFYYIFKGGNKMKNSKPRTKSSWKQDRAKIALSQKHERTYLKKIAKELLRKFEVNRKAEKEKEGNNKQDLTLWPLKGSSSLVYLNSSGLIRCLKALIKYLKRDDRNV